MKCLVALAQLDNLSFTSAELHIKEKTEELKAKDDAISELEKKIKEKSNSISSLQSEIVSLQVNN